MSGSGRRAIYFGAFFLLQLIEDTYHSGRGASKAGARAGAAIGAANGLANKGSGAANGAPSRVCVVL